ncbi:MAG: class I tRNA ligase family protein, partial [Patescibacteria group bacterium]
EIEHNVSSAQRTGGTIELLPKLQWFVAVNKEFKRDGKMTTLKELMKEAVSATSIKIVPDRFEKVYFHWVQNLRDWCISRQIWYGHRIPVWYKIVNKSSAVSLGREQSSEEAKAERGRAVPARSDAVSEEIYIGIEAPKGDDWVQDEDTLDTWFSSGLWTFSTLGWPNETEDLKNYHPTAILETGSDLIFFWVARMILMSTYLLNDIPFKTVYFHGIVRDSKGRKISKSLGDNIDPLNMIARYGADATRMSLIIGVGPGSDSKIDEQKIKAYKLFANKLWNIARFILTNCDSREQSRDEADTFPRDLAARGDSSRGKVVGEVDETVPEIGSGLADEVLYEELRTLLTDITTDMENYRYYLAGEKLYHYVWHRFADNISEESKKI